MWSQKSSWNWKEKLPCLWRIIRLLLFTPIFPICATIPLEYFKDESQFYFYFFSEKISTIKINIFYIHKNINFISTIAYTRIVFLLYRTPNCSIVDNIHTLNIQGFSSLTCQPAYLLSYNDWKISKTQKLPLTYIWNLNVQLLKIKWYLIYSQQCMKNVLINSFCRKSIYQLESILIKFIIKNIKKFQLRFSQIILKFEFLARSIYQNYIFQIL